MNHRFIVPLQEHFDEVLFLPDASAADWARILSHSKLLKLSPGDAIVHAGEVDRAILLLAEGAVFVMNGREVVKTIEAPSVLGEIAFLDGGPRSAGLVAGTDVEAARFDIDAFETLSGEDPDLARRIAFDLGRIVALRLRIMEAARRA